MYRLTHNDDCVMCLSDNTVVPRGHRWWDDYEVWLAEGNTPEPADPIPSKRPSEIAARLTQIDAESVRPLRAKLAGSATNDDDDKLEALDLEAAELRKELRGMTT